MKKIIIVLLFLSNMASAQFFGNFIEDRFVSGKDGNYILLLDEKYMEEHRGLFPDIYKSNPYFLIERSVDNKSFQVIDTLRPVQSAGQFEKIYGDGIFAQMKADTSLSKLSEAEIIALFQDANDKSLAPLFYFEPVKQLRAVGHAFLDEKVKKGETYFYQVKNASNKIVTKGKVLAGAPNKTLNSIHLRFNQASVAAIDSAIVGSWFQFHMKNRMAFKVNFYGKETFDQDYKLLNTQKVIYKDDSLVVSLNHVVNGKQIWDVFVVPEDMLGNEGSPSDTATLASFSKANLPFPKDFVAKDSADGIHLSWLPVMDHSFVAGYVISREMDGKIFEILDTIPPNRSTYIDYNVLSGDKYNYEIQVLPGPISNFKWRDFPSVRTAGVHTANERLLPPGNINLQRENKYVKIRWEEPDGLPVLAYYVFSSLTGKPEDFS